MALHDGSDMSRATYMNLHDKPSIGDGARGQSNIGKFAKDFKQGSDHEAVLQHYLFHGWLRATPCHISLDSVSRVESRRPVSSGPAKDVRAPVAVRTDWDRSKKFPSGLVQISSDAIRCRESSQAKRQYREAVGPTPKSAVDEHGPPVGVMKLSPSLAWAITFRAVQGIHCLSETACRTAAMLPRPRSLSLGLALCYLST
jgi:hypothetical protein